MIARPGYRALITVRGSIWAHRPGFAVHHIARDLTEAQERACALAAAFRVPLAPGVWPLDTPDHATRIAVGPVYVGARTRRIRALGRDVVTYYVLRRRYAGEPTVQADPTWTVPMLAVPAPSTEVPDAPPAWPFTLVGRRAPAAGSTTFGARAVTWRGSLLGQTVTFTTRPRPITPTRRFPRRADAHVDDAGQPQHVIDLCVHHPVSEAVRAALAELAQARDPRPVVVRCAGESLRLAAEADRHDIHTRLTSRQSGTHPPGDARAADPGRSTSEPDAAR